MTWPIAWSPPPTARSGTTRYRSEQPLSDGRGSDRGYFPSRDRQKANFFPSPQPWASPDPLSEASSFARSFGHFGLLSALPVARDRELALFQGVTCRLFPCAPRATGRHLRQPALFLQLLSERPADTLAGFATIDRKST